MRYPLVFKALEHGFRISGTGPCEWAQVPCWPIPHREQVREFCFPEASDEFVEALMIANDVELEREEDAT